MTDIDAAVNVLGGETNKVIYDDIGMPSILVEIEEIPFTFDGVSYGEGISHPAFIVNSVKKSKFYVSKYQNVLLNGRAYSLPLQVPNFNMSFDASIEACSRKGLGWHLMTNAEWAYLAILGHLPRGNNNGGCDYRGEERGGARIEKADRSLSDYIFTGSGPVAYSHNGLRSGIWDLNGNSNEWVGGLRLLNGEIQIIKDNDAADFTNPQTADSNLWMALLESGELVIPETENTLKLDYTATPSSASDAMIIAKSLQYPQSEVTHCGISGFKNLSARSDVSVPHIMKALALSPWDNTEDGYISMKNIYERIAVRGGGALDQNKAGIRTLGLNNLRDLNGFAFRSAYVDILDNVALADEDGTALATEKAQIVH